MSDELATIVIPCYAHADVLPRAVRSALAQTYPHVEVVVVDDGNVPPLSLPDDVARDARVRVVRHAQNMGLPAALNTGVQHARGARFVICAADDELHPEHVARTIVHDADIVSTDFMADGRVVACQPGTLAALRNANCHGYAALVRKALWAHVGGFKAYMNPSWEDWEFWLNCAKHGATWAHVRAPLHVYHRNPHGRDALAQGRDALLYGKLHGAHQDVYGQGRGVVAFVIPCYAHARYVRGAVLSVLRQVYPHTVAVVVDDGSPDDVPAALGDVLDDVRVVLARHAQNMGLPAARNTGIRVALARWQPEYMVMLDADDEVDALFIEHVLAHVLHEQRYYYTDVRFIGDAWHVREMEEYDCARLAHRHLHPCTFLARAQLWQDVAAQRGYAYDEAMRHGWEDWEFALAAVRAGWCGQRVAGALFHYRYHAGGSMRTRAHARRQELRAYLLAKHPWISSTGGIMAGCSGCGGGGFRRASLNDAPTPVRIPELGDLAPDDPVYVTYTGSTTSTITKIGAHGTVYKYSADPNATYGPTFTIYARDAHLFRGPYVLRRQPPEEDWRDAAGVPASAPASRAHVPDATDQQLARAAQRQAPEPEPDDLTKLAGVDEAGAQRLRAAGITRYEDVLAAPTHELVAILGISGNRTGVLRASAKRILQWRGRA